DALSFARKGDRSLRPVLEGAYNRASDLGLIAKTFWSGGEDDVNALKVTVGRPIRSQLAERLPNPEAVIKKLGLVAVQPKYEGIAGSTVLLPAPIIKTDSVEVLTKTLLDSISQGLEGVVVKRPESKYQAGARNFNWVKLKRHTSGELNDTVDLVLLGYYFGKG